MLDRRAEHRIAEAIVTGTTAYEFSLAGCGAVVPMVPILMIPEVVSVRTRSSACTLLSWTHDLKLGSMDGLTFRSMQIDYKGGV